MSIPLFALYWGGEYSSRVSITISGENTIVLLVVGESTTTSGKVLLVVGELLLVMGISTTSSGKKSTCNSRGKYYS